MKYNYQEKQSTAIRISLTDDSDQEIARAYIFLITNDLHDQPYALLEDVFVAEEHRGKGFGKQLIEHAVKKARDLGCYKLIGTSRNERPKVHQFYEKLGFDRHGFEFRLNL
ncbi:GNAT family N-acetyltransferase [archaeon]|jgi:GNAT superfamily N-acetyltransferase|nr:GNAT family N-acetyltransferase [archaeon]MBT6762052.1 GNAT family N-acetyltransferase [archaeon]